MMQKNVGMLDGWLRFSAGFVILFVGYMYKQPWALLGVIPMLTFAFSWCPLYTFLKFNTKDQGK